MNTETLYGFIVGLVFGIIAISATCFVLEDYTPMYKSGVMNTKKEAFKKGLMYKEVDDNDTVLYRWGIKKN